MEKIKLITISAAIIGIAVFSVITFSSKKTNAAQQNKYWTYNAGEGANCLSVKFTCNVAYWQDICIKGTVANKCMCHPRFCFGR